VLVPLLPQRDQLYAFNMSEARESTPIKTSDKYFITRDKVLLFMLKKFNVFICFCFNIYSTHTFPKELPEWLIIGNKHNQENRCFKKFHCGKFNNDDFDYCIKLLSGEGEEKQYLANGIFFCVSGTKDDWICRRGKMCVSPHYARRETAKRFILMI